MTPADFAGSSASWRILLGFPASQLIRRRPLGQNWQHRPRSAATAIALMIHLKAMSQPGSKKIHLRLQYVL